MRAIIGLTIAAMMMAGSAHAEWQLIGYSPAVMTAIDTDTIRITGSTRRAWWVMVMADDTGYLVAREEFDCESETRVTVDLTIYDANHRAIASDVPTATRRSPPPGSISEEELHFVCSGGHEHPDTFEDKESFVRWARPELYKIRNYVAD